MKPAEERVGWRVRQHTVARTTRQGDASTGRVCGATFRAEVRSRIANPWEVRALRLRRALVDADNVYPIRVTGSASEIARLVPVNTRQWSCRKLTGGVGGGTPDVGGVTVGGEGGLGGESNTGGLRRDGSGGVRRSASAVGRSLDRRKSNAAEGYVFSRPMHRRARIVTAARATRENVNARAQIVLHSRWHSKPGSLRGWVQRSTSALTVKVESAARREVSSAEARVTTEARLGAAGATARTRRDSVLPTKAGRATTVEAAEVMAAILTT